MKRPKGLIAATFTPLHAKNGSLWLEAIPAIVERLYAEGVQGLYVCGSTGEGSLLTREERQVTVEAYIEATAGRMPVIVQVGHESLVEAKGLAKHAQEVGADAISAAPPSYFKPRSAEVLVECLLEITSGAPALPFYYYHIPSMNGVELDIVKLLKLAAQHLPTLVGIKYSSPKTQELQACLDVERGRYTMLFGVDEALLSGLCAGAHGAVGSTYNFAAPLYQRIIAAFEQADLAEAQRCQALAVRMVRTILQYGALPALKATMKLIGLDCGPTRLPLVALSREHIEALHRDLEEQGFFEWTKR